MNRVGSLAGKYGFDALVVIVAVGAALDVALRDDPVRAPRTTPWLVVPTIALVVLPLLFRRRFPFGAPVAVWIIAAAASFTDGRLIVFAVGASVAGIVAAFLLGNLDDPVQARIGLLVALAATTTIIYNDPQNAPGDFVFAPVLFATGWLAGYALRARAVQAEAAEQRAVLAERERETAARIAVAEERARIARELHDVVAHAVSVMLLQVGAVRHKLPDDLAEDREALKGVEQAGRSALTEMRRLLGAMGRNGEGTELTPQPGLDSVDALLDEVRRAGLPVGLQLDGDRFPVPRGVDLSAYRIIQEGLTNVLKHAHASHALVTVRYGSSDLQIEIRDDGRGAATTDGLGHGLVGMRERVKIYGGEMTTGTAAGGGFVLTTRFPLSTDGR